LLCIPIGLGLRSLWGLPGLAIALGISTSVIAAGLMATISLTTLEIAAVGLGRLALAVGASAAVAFGGMSLLLEPVPAALVGVAVYAALMYALRSLGLSDAWTYVRGLH
jgi:uncharacterized membrane protein